MGAYEYLQSLDDEAKRDWDRRFASWVHERRPDLELKPVARSGASRSMLIYGCSTTQTPLRIGQ
jgi:hypothetical protein